MKNFDTARDFYSGSSGVSYQRKVNHASTAAFSIIARERALKFQPFVNANDVVFEYGTGTGWNLAELICKERLGYDVANYLTPEAFKKKIRFISEVGQLAKHSVDVVICHHVMEHLSNPFETLKGFQNVLKHSGRLIIHVPFDRGRRFLSYDSNDSNKHLYAWNCQALGNLVSSAGYEINICRLQKFGYDRISGEIASMFGFGGRIFKLVRQLFHLIREDKEIFLLAEIDHKRE